MSSGGFIASKVHKVQRGESLARIANSLGLGYLDLVEANPNINADRLKIGTPVRIPARTELPTDVILAAFIEPDEPTKPKEGVYVVRNGDTDWSIAPKFDISRDKLTQLNPSVNWRRLQIGQQLNVPLTDGSDPAKVLMASYTPPKQSSQPVTYTVKSGDNDWVIASRLGIKPSELRSMNPGINWRRLQIGQKLNGPGASGDLGLRSTRVVVKSSSVNVRASATVNSRRVSAVSRGRTASVIDRKGDWYKLKFSSGLVGWVRGDLIREATSAEAASASRSRRSSSSRSSGPIASNSPLATSSLVATAKSLIGTPYKWGGTFIPAKYRSSALTSRGGGRYSSSRPNGALDCSAFVKVVYGVHGTSLPRTSASQSGIGSYVPKSKLEVGDLVFFKTRRNTRVSHVGIYIGSGQFIHASSGGGKVRIDKLSTSYYAKRYVTARRPSVKKSAAPKPADPVKAAEQEAQAKIADSNAADKAAMKKALGQSGG
jgi:cell wall-associated NlpC family hydrolase